MGSAKAGSLATLRRSLLFLVAKRTESIMTSKHKRAAAISTFSGSAALLICFPISVLGYVPELVIAVCMILVAVSLILGISSMPTKIGMVAWAVSELFLGSLIGWLFCYMWFN